MNYLLIDSHKTVGTITVVYGFILKIIFYLGGKSRKFSELSRRIEFGVSSFVNVVLIYNNRFQGPEFIAILSTDLLAIFIL
jgi:hypothetical protein